MGDEMSTSPWWRNLMINTRLTWEKSTPSGTLAELISLGWAEEGVLLIFDPDSAGR